MSNPPQPLPAAGAAASDPLAGTKYRVVRVLGSGGWGIVYEAVHVDLGKRFAVKVVLRAYARDRMALERLRVEAQALGHLRSRHIVDVSDFGHTEDGRPFLVMPLLVGRTMTEEVRQRRCLPPEEAVELVQQLLAGLDVAHRAGFVHRDVKLDNLFLCDEGGQRLLKILDFGIARVLPRAEGVEPPGVRTGEGEVVGTPRFIPPEQAMGREAGPPADLYGAGVVLYELLTGRDPYSHVSGFAPLLKAHVSEDAPAPSRIAPQPIQPELDEVVMRALAKRPENRYATAAELSAALSRALGRGTIERRSGAVHTFKPGDTFYYFVIERELGFGLDGAVYEIVHRETGDRFALKTMHAADCVDPSKTARALVAAKANSRIDHKNILKVFDLNCESSGMVWVRTELLRGCTFQELIARHGRLSLPFALAATIEAAFGLAEMHGSQIVHRDVKPSNLFCTEGRGVKVLDFGLAKVFPEGLETTVGRRVGVGSPAYAAPEQLEGHARPDVRFDVHGLGMTLWEMLAGRHPDADVLGDLQALLKRRITTMPPSLAEVAGLPPRVDAVVRRAILKDPTQRYASMMEMARALMDLSAWVAAESRAGRLAIVVPHGEPPLPGDTNTWRDYRAPEPAPAHESPPSGPRERVLVAGGARGPAPLIATQAMPPSRSAGLAATLPLDQAPGAADALPPAPPPLRPTPTAVASTQQGARAAKPRSSWLVAVGALAAASIGAVALVVWIGGRGPVPAVSEPLPAASATVTEAKQATETPLVPETVAPPAVTTTAAAPAASAAPSASASARAVATSRKPLPRTPGPSAVYPQPAPAPAPARTPSGPVFRGE